MLQVAGFLDNSNVNGTGLRSVLFLSGCPHHCKNCQNPDMQNIFYGDTLTLEIIWKRIEKNIPLIDGLTLSGGEPFEQSYALLPLVQKVKAAGLTVWCYTGYLYEDLLKNTNHAKLLSYIDVLVDGPFVFEQYDEHLKLKGSANQRIIKLKEGKLESIIG